MRAPLVIPALLFLDALVVTRDCAPTAAVMLAALAATAWILGATRAQGVAALAVAFGCWCGAWHGPPPALEVEIPHVVLRGIVAGDVNLHAESEAFELLADDGRRYAVMLREPVEIGERLVVQGRLAPFDEPRNPEEPSQRTFAAERGLTARLEQGRLLARAPPDPRDLRTLPARLRKLATDALHRSLGEPDATLVAGMLYGARGALPPELRAEFQDTGTVHILVTAGLHLGVIAALLAFVFARIGLGRVPGALATIPLVWGYAILSGAHLPSLRAATMVSVALLARASGERAISLNTLALAAVVVGALWPAAVGGASFALSFSCVGAIVLFAEPIAGVLERTRLPSLCREALALTLATQIGVWPLTAAVFLVIAPYAPLANLLVVPVAGVALGGALVLLAVQPVAPLATIAGRIEAWPLAWIESVVHLTASLPFAHIVATPPPLWAIVAYDLALIAVALTLRARSQIRS